MTAREIDWGITYRHALSVCRHDTDPEDMAGAVVEELWRAVRAGRISAPSRAAVRQAQRNVWCLRRARRYRRYWERTSPELDPDRLPDLADRDQLDLAWVRMIISRVWPLLTGRERDGVVQVLSGEATVGDVRGTHARPRGWWDIVEALRGDA